MKIASFMLFLIAITSVKILASDVENNPNIFQGKDFKIVWNDEDGGTVFFEPDRYFKDPWQTEFKDFTYNKSHTIMPNRPDVYERRIIKRSSSKEDLDDFSRELRVIKICKIFELINEKYLFEHGFLTEGKDYIKKPNGIITIIGKSSFALEHTTMSLIGENLVPLKEKEKYRKYQLNNITLKTY